MLGRCWVALEKLFLLGPDFYCSSTEWKPQRGSKAQQGQSCSQMPDNLCSHKRVRDPLALLSHTSSEKSGAATTDLQAHKMLLKMMARCGAESVPALTQKYKDQISAGSQLLPHYSASNISMFFESASLDRGSGIRCQVL